MRIITGKCRGRKLKGPRGLELRPTSDRLRETLFNILAPRIAGSAFLDVFAGTGAVGIEALSRGAREAVFIDNAADSVRLVRANLDLCGITAGYRVIAQDAFRALRGLAREQFTADFMFADPPYDWDPYADIVELVFKSTLIGPEGLLIAEHHFKANLPDRTVWCERTRVVRQGATCLSFYRRT